MLQWYSGGGGDDQGQNRVAEDVEASEWISELRSQISTLKKRILPISPKVKAKAYEALQSRQQPLDAPISFLNASLLVLLDPPGLLTVSSECQAPIISEPLRSRSLCLESSSLTCTGLKSHLLQVFLHVPRSPSGLSWPHDLRLDSPLHHHSLSALFFPSHLSASEYYRIYWFPGFMMSSSPAQLHAPWRQDFCLLCYRGCPVPRWEPAPHPYLTADWTDPAECMVHRERGLFSFRV